MADIFLSYARADQPAAAKIAAALEAAGHSVWWDQHLASGHDFSEDIERELEAARAVVVLWSATSVKSHWVRDEAAFGQRAGKLIPATIDGTEPPMGFRQLHTTNVDADAPGPLVAAVGAMLSGERLRPSSTPAPVASDKKKHSPWVIAAIAAIAIAGATGLLRPDVWDRFGGGDDRDAPVGQEISLAVMPFVTSGSADIDYLGVGLSSSLASDLASLEGLQLTANSSTSALAGQGLTATEIGDRLGVSHLVEGIVTETGSGLRVEVSLVDTSNARQLWTDTYAGTAQSLQQITADVAQGVAVALQSRLGAGAGRVVRADNIDPRAFEAYLRAREAQTKRLSADNRRRALSEYRRAVALAPDFADAQAGLAYLLALSPGFDFGMSAQEHEAQYQAAQANIDRLDPDHYLGRAAKVFGHYGWTFDLEAAEQVARDLIAEAPEFAPGQYALGRVLLNNGDAEGAADAFVAALRRDPFNRTISVAHSYALFQTGNYDRFADYARQCDDCTYLGIYWFDALTRLGNRADYDRDWGSIRQSLLENRDVAAGQIDGVERYALALVSDRKMPRPEPFNRIDEAPPAEGVVANQIHLMAYAGDAQSALDALANGIAGTSTAGNYAMLLPGRSGFDEAVRADPRYHAYFEHPVNQAMLAKRRKNGDTGFHPVFPVKPYEGN